MITGGPRTKLELELAAEVDRLQTRVAELAAAEANAVEYEETSRIRGLEIVRYEARVAELETALRAAFVRLTDPHERAPKAAVAEVIADALGVPIADLTLASVTLSTSEHAPMDRNGETWDADDGRPMNPDPIAQWANELRSGIEDLIAEADPDPDDGVRRVCARDLQRLLPK